MLPELRRCFYPRPMRHAIAALAMTACTATVPATTPTTPPAAPTTAEATGYPDYQHVDHNHPYFIALEPTGIIEGHTHQRTWGLGLRTCNRLDTGWTFDRLITNLTDDNVTNPGALIGAAVAHICDHHLDAAQQWADTH